LPKFGTWIGASPEILASQDAQEIFHTVALAGTQKTLGRSEKEAVWSQKEIEEQAYVRRYIIDCLKFIRLREFEDIGPKTVRVGHLFHLRTDFIVDLKQVDFPHLLSTMVHLLHPTAAVCGTPKKEALDYILQEEGFDRELFGGYLGPVNVQGETHLFVNLRCARWKEGEMTLFAGAGITEDSVPEMEFLETESKMESLMKLL
jgi:isochorismate synthase